jgi:hypothetical protein
MASNPAASNIVWFDIQAKDLDRAIAFYSTVLNRPVEKQEGPGFAMGFFQHTDDVVGGCIYVGEEPPVSGAGPLLYFNVQGRLEEAASLVEANGGQILQPVHQIGPHGFRAVVVDSEGNRIALHSM